MLKVILLAAIVALASSASATYWKQCEPLSTKINRFELHDCDQQISTDDRCGLEMDSNHKLEIDYIQPKPIQHPVIRKQALHELDLWLQSSGCRNGLECPGETGQEQHFRRGLYFSRVATYPTKSDFRLTIRENGTSYEQPDHLCVEFSVLIFPPEV